MALRKYEYISKLLGLASVKDSRSYNIYGAQRWNQYVTPYLV